MSRTNQILAGVTLIAVVVVAIVWQSSSKPAANDQQVIHYPEAVLADEPMDSVTDAIVDGSQQPFSQPLSYEEHAKLVFEPIIGNTQEKAEIDKWFNDGGYSIERKDEYADYSEDILRQLAEGGDFRAMNHYAWKLLRKPGELDAARHWFNNAIVHGSLAAFDDIAIITETRVMEKADTPEQMHQAALESLSWYEAAALRGNKRSGYYHSPGFIRRHSIQLTPEDVAWITVRAQAIYQDFAEQRIAAGLGEFDNTVPPVVQGFYARLAESLSSNERAKYGLPPL